MIEQIKHELKIHLQNSWMSASTKTQALLKLNSMKFRVGFNQFHIDYQSLSIQPQSYVKNAMAIKAFETKRQLLKIGHLVEADEWDMAPQSINAYYDVSQNQINIPTGYSSDTIFCIQPPMHELWWYGAVIGHEISHGFDGSGCRNLMSMANSKAGGKKKIGKPINKNFNVSYNNILNIQFKGSPIDISMVNS